MDELSVKAIADLARDAAGVKTVILPDGQIAAVVPEGYRLDTLRTAAQLFAPPPARVRQRVALTEKTSFIGYVKDFGEVHSRIFADLAQGRFEAVFDYHDHQHGGDGPQHLDHRATFTLQVSEEWKRWAEIDGKLMGQVEFARWLEENLADIDSPSGADILEIVRDFSAARKVNFTSSVRLQNGDVGFEYVDETKAASRSGALEVPNLFVLRLPVWYGEPAVELRAFLRYTVADGSLKIGIQLHRPAYVKQAVFEVIGRDIAVATQLPLHFGSIG